MTDYADLIERLEYHGESGSPIGKNAAAALRELVRERDALNGLIRFMIEAMIRDALAAAKEGK